MTGLDSTRRLLREPWTSTFSYIGRSTLPTVAQSNPANLHSMWQANVTVTQENNGLIVTVHNCGTAWTSVWLHFQNTISDLLTKWCLSVNWRSSFFARCLNTVYSKSILSLKTIQLQIFMLSCRQTYGQRMPILRKHWLAPATIHQLRMHNVRYEKCDKFFLCANNNMLATNQKQATGQSDPETSIGRRLYVLGKPTDNTQQYT